MLVVSNSNGHLNHLRTARRGLDPEKVADLGQETGNWSKIELRSWEIWFQMVQNKTVAGSSNLITLPRDVPVLFQLCLWSITVHTIHNLQRSNQITTVNTPKPKEKSKGEFRQHSRSIRVCEDDAHHNSRSYASFDILGFPFSVFGMQVLVYILAIAGWFLVTGTLILCG